MSRKLSNRSNQITPRNRVFLEYLSSGLSTFDAYRKAGYKGNYHAAYELKSQLKSALLMVLEAKGFSREGLAAEILKLNQLPLNDMYASGINLDQKLKILKLLNASLPKEKEAKVGQVTVLNFGKSEDGKTVVQTCDVVEAESKIS